MVLDCMDVVDGGEDSYDDGRVVLLLWHNVVSILDSPLLHMSLQGWVVHNMMMGCCLFHVASYVHIGMRCVTRQRLLMMYAMELV